MQYYVLRVLKHNTLNFLPSVVFTSKDATDASIYASVMQRQEDGHDYIVVKEA